MDAALQKYWSELVKIISTEQLKMLLNAKYGINPEPANPIIEKILLDELRYRGGNKMEDKYSGSVKIETWRSRKVFNNHDYVATNHRTDVITFKDGRYFGVLLDPKTNIMAKIPIDRCAGNKKYTKEEITEAIIKAWDKGEYAEDQTDINWIFNPDPKGFTGTVDLATVLLKDREGNNGCFEASHSPQIRARCRVRIVDGTFFEKLDGSSELADIFKNYRYTFSTEGDIAKYVKGKWCVRDFGNDASYYTLEIEEG
jgi:hypothetical protein